MPFGTKRTPCCASTKPARDKRIKLPSAVATVARSLLFASTLQRLAKACQLLRFQSYLPLAVGNTVFIAARSQPPRQHSRGKVFVQPGQEIGQCVLNTARFVNQSYSFQPEWMAATPPVRLRYVTRSKPASRIMSANLSCSGNLRIDSTKYL